MLSLTEPSLLLYAPTFGALGRSIGNADTFDTHLASPRLRSLGGVEAGIGGDQMRHTAQLLLMHLDGFDQQCRVGGPLITNFIVGDDLILRFLDLDQSAELGRLR